MGQLIVQGLSAGLVRTDSCHEAGLSSHGNCARFFWEFPVEDRVESVEVEVSNLHSMFSFQS